MNIEIIRNTLYKVCPTGGVGRFTWGAGLGHICSELPSGPQPLTPDSRIGHKVAWNRFLAVQHPGAGG